MAKKNAASTTLSASAVDAAIRPDVDVAALAAELAPLPCGATIQTISQYIMELDARARLHYAARGRAVKRLIQATCGLHQC